MKLYEIGEGVNRIRVRAHDEETELYDMAPVEVVWVRDATPPELEWLWVPETVGGARFWGLPFSLEVLVFVAVSRRNKS